MPGWRRLRSVALLGALIGAALGGCGGDDSPKPRLGPREWKASVYTTVLRDVALPIAHRSMPDAERPVVYLATSDGSGIGVEVQTMVARDLKDEADLRIEDNVGDVILDDEDGRPVKDGGLLVTVTPLPEEQPNQVQVTAVLYLDEDQVDTIDVSLSRTSGDWTVRTSVPEG